MKRVYSERVQKGFKKSTNNTKRVITIIQKKVQKIVHNEFKKKQKE